MMVRTLGIDISLNHGALFLLLNGEMLDFRFVTDRKTIVEKTSKSRAHGIYLSAAKLKDKQQRDVLRACFWYSYLEQALRDMAPNYIAIEDYAYRAPQSAYHLGEVGGAARILAWRSRARFRLHDPASLKMFAVHSGNANAQETMRGILARWPKLEDAIGKFKDGKDERTVEDLCDAYALAKFVWLEVLLRNGRKKLSKLHPKEIQVFNRCTSRYPMNILARDWLSRGAK